MLLQLNVLGVYLCLISCVNQYSCRHRIPLRRRTLSVDWRHIWNMGGNRAWKKYVNTAVGSYFTVLLTLSWILVSIPLVSYLDLYNHSNWDWRTWWGTCSLAASAMAPEERPGLKAARWKKWDQSLVGGADFLFSNGHSPPSNSQPLTRTKASKDLKFKLLCHTNNNFFKCILYWTGA